MKPDITIDPKKASHLKGGTIRFPEYDTITGNDRLISIEYCSNCKDHEMHTIHRSESYYQIAHCFAEAIKIRYPAIKILLKPIDTHILKDFAQSYKLLEKSKNINDKYKPVRIGAFEINLVIDKKEQVLHSKIDTNQWPNLQNILDKISQFTPKINININLYNLDTEAEKNQNKENDEDEQNKFKELRINLYRVNFENIKKIKSVYQEELELLSKPKGIKNFIKTMEYMQENSIINSEQTRPFSASFYKSYEKIKPKNKLSLYSNKRYINFERDWNETMIYNKDEIEHYKGLVIKENLLIDKDGKTESFILPYDSYLIEVMENKNYNCLGNFIRFNHIQNTNECVVSKYLPLQKQQNSYLIILVNRKIINNNEDENDFELISEADVRIKKIPQNNNQIEFDKNNETRIKVKECDAYKGKYDIVIEPGRYIIEVNKAGFEEYKKAVTVECGENINDVELSTFKKTNLIVSCYNFEKFIPLSNIYLKLNYLSSEEGYEGVTDSQGKFVFKNLKNDHGVSIKADKKGFFPIVRTFLWDLESNVENKEIIFILVNKDYIVQNNSIVMVVYSNLPGENFECYFDYSKAISSYIDIDQFDTQSDHGVVSNLIKLRKSVN